LFSYAVVAQTVRPQLALAFYGDLPGAAGRLGDQLVANSAQRADNSQQPPSAIADLDVLLSNNARIALRRSAERGLAATPLTSVGLRQLALVERDPRQRRRLLELADRVSRRDVLAALQLSQIQAQDGDIQGALNNFNRALVISDEADSLIFPNLMRSTANPEFRAQIADLLRRNPDWAVRLVRWAIDNPEALPALSNLVGRIPRGSEALAVGFGQQMVDQLNNQRRFPEEFAIYDAYSPKPQNPADLSRLAFPPIDWRLIDNIDSGSRPYGKGAIEVFSDPGRTGDVMQMLTRLAPGSYTWSMRIKDSSGQDSQLQLTASCVQAPQTKGLGTLQRPLRNGVLTLQFSVNSQCPYQMLTVGISGGHEAGDALLDAMTVTAGQHSPTNSTR
jgi:hypothetical protein